MKKILFLTLERTTPATRFRVLHWLHYLETNGHQVTVRHKFPDHLPKFIYALNLNKLYYWLRLPFIFIGRLISLRDADRYDYIFLQRPLSGRMALGQISILLERILFSRNRNVIYDFDDAVFLDFDGEPNNTKAMQFKFIGANAQKIVAGNQYLANAAQTLNTNVQVIPTCIDTAKYYPIETTQPKNKIVIGWIGTISNYPFLNIITDVIKAILEKYPQQVTFRVVSQHHPLDNVLPQLRYEFHKWNEETELSEINNFDIGVMPLNYNHWTLGKCGFKLIQCMACGKPVVASNVGENQNIVDDSYSGFLVETEAEWIAALSKLIENPALRAQTGENARKKIEEKYSIRAYQETFLGLFE